MSSEKKDGEEEVPCDLEPDKKKMKMSSEKDSGNGDGDGDLDLVEDENDKNVSYNYEFWSSDEELKEDDIDVFKRYQEQMIKSGGFDIDYRPPLLSCTLGPLNNLEEDQERYERLCYFSREALKKFNEDHDTSYEFFKFVKAVWGFAAGTKYYITFEAKDASEATTTFQAFVLQGMPNWSGTYDPDIVLVRMKSSATEKDNEILLC